MEYDFEYLKNLYIDDPDKFDEITTAMLNEVIDSAPLKRREQFRAKQWRLEHDLEKIKNPTERMNKMVAMFWIGVTEFITVMEDLTVEDEKRSTITNTKPATVIDINRKK